MELCNICTKSVHFSLVFINCGIDSLAIDFLVHCHFEHIISDEARLNVRITSHFDRVQMVQIALSM